MATNTTNYGFKKPDESDFYDVQDQNNNWDLADGALKELDTPTFEDYTGDTKVPAAATALESIRSKGKLATLLSNIKAFCKGCITLAMLVNDTATNNSQLPVSSAVTHDLQQQLNVLNTNLQNYGVVDVKTGMANKNDYWATAGTAVYRVVNGICTIYFDVTIVEITVNGALIFSGIPIPKMNVYQNYIGETGKQAQFYVNDGISNLNSSVGNGAGRYYGSFSYPTV